MPRVFQLPEVELVGSGADLPRELCVSPVSVSTSIARSTSASPTSVRRLKRRRSKTLLQKIASLDNTLEQSGNKQPASLSPRSSSLSVFDISAAEASENLQSARGATYERWCSVQATQYLLPKVFQFLAFDSLFGSARLVCSSWNEAALNQRSCVALTVPAAISKLDGKILKCSIANRYRLLQKLSFKQCSSLLPVDYACIGDLSQLRSLDLSGCVTIDDDGLAFLAKLPLLSSLNVSHLNITGRGLCHLPRRFSLFSRMLDHINTMAATVRHLLLLCRLRRLYANHCTSLTDSSLGHIRFVAQSLQVLELRCTPVTNAGLAPLLKHMRVLTSIALDGCKLQDATLLTLAHSRHLKKTLQALSLSGVRGLSAASVVQLQKMSLVARLDLDSIACVTGRIARWLRKACPSLEELRASPDEEDDGDDDDADFLFQLEQGQAFWLRGALSSSNPHPPAQTGETHTDTCLAPPANQSACGSKDEAVVVSPNLQQQTSQTKAFKSSSSSDVSLPELDEETTSARESAPPDCDFVISSAQNTRRDTVVKGKSRKRKFKAPYSSISSLSSLGCSMPESKRTTGASGRNECLLDSVNKATLKHATPPASPPTASPTAPTAPPSSSLSSLVRSSSLSSLSVLRTPRGRAAPQNPRTARRKLCAAEPPFVAGAPAYTAITSAKKKPPKDTAAPGDSLPAGQEESADTTSWALSGQASDQAEREVESIIEIATGARRPYRVRWKGLGPEMDSWLKRSHFSAGFSLMMRNFQKLRQQDKLQQWEPWELAKPMPPASTPVLGASAPGPTSAAANVAAPVANPKNLHIENAKIWLKAPHRLAAAVASVVSGLRELLEAPSAAAADCSEALKTISTWRLRLTTFLVQQRTLDPCVQLQQHVWTSACHENLAKLFSIERSLKGLDAKAQKLQSASLSASEGTPENVVPSAVAREVSSPHAPEEEEALDHRGSRKVLYDEMVSEYESVNQGKISPLASADLWEKAYVMVAQKQDQLAAFRRLKRRKKSKREAKKVDVSKVPIMSPRRAPTQTSNMPYYTTPPASTSFASPKKSSREATYMYPILGSPRAREMQRRAQAPPSPSTPSSPSSPSRPNPIRPILEVVETVRVRKSSHMRGRRGSLRRFYEQAPRVSTAAAPAPASAQQTKKPLAKPVNSAQPARRYSNSPLSKLQNEQDKWELLDYD